MVLNGVFQLNELDQVWSILPALELLPLNLNSWGGATPMQAKWIKPDLWMIIGYFYLLHMFCHFKFMSI